MLQEIQIKNLYEFILQFLYIALGSLAELETQLILSNELEFIDNDRPLKDVEHIRKMLTRFNKISKKSQ